MRKWTTIALFTALTCAGQNDQKGAVRGRFIDDLSQQGIPKIRLQFEGPGLLDPLVVDTDTNGAFSVTGLTPGTYQMQFDKAGYFVPATGPHPIAVAPSQTLDLGETVLPRHRRITGTLRWPDGEPVDARVLAIPVIAGRPRADRTGIVADVHDGAYTLSDLQPGRYQLVAYYAESQGPSRLAPVTASPIYYPGVANPAGAAIIDLRVRAEASQMNFVLERKRGVIVEGPVVSTNSPNAYVALFAGNAPGISLMTSQVKAGERFRFTGVPEGEYLLVASGDGARIQPLTVGMSDIRNLSVTVPEPSSVVETAEIEEPGETPPKLTPVKRPVARGRIPALGGSLGGSGYPGSDGILRHRGLVNGMTYQLEFNPPAGTYVYSVTQGDLTQTMSPFSFVANGQPFNIRLRRDGGTVSVAAAAGAFVLLAPRNRKDELRYLSGFADKNGVFQWTAVAPGEYDVLAFSREPDSYFDEEFLRRNASNSVAVEVKPNGSATARPKLIP